MGTFKFHKSLPDDTTTQARKMEESMDTVFEQLVYFREELEQHTGKAAISLRDELDEHIEFFSKASVGILNFADVIQAFVTEIALSDEGVLACAPPLQGRLEYQYSFSSSRIEQDIYLHPGALEQATESFESNLESLREILSSFNILIENIISKTHFPWDDVSDIWDASQEEISSVLQEAENRVTNLKKSSEGLIKELTRVDNLISHQMQMLQ